ncbi:hypothetical protein GCM10027160_44040 [Streptomyces calidiresistens]|uniref:Uncharacterized protein n=1 Tax=Streptomyces calidiresistens TaxID=1485586 RepID=A0A7W3T2V4_9ACTN|nr:hypothetical protein [Streptomyces calidiresistens]MBB0229935.1 hypothetical protein [Streptomyces calidiresistens]
MTDTDPRRHLLSTRRYQWDSSGAAVSRPVGFAEEAAERRESLSHGLEDARATITGNEALVGAALLKEFAARLRHDLAQGTIAPDAEELAQVATDLADRMTKAGGLTD